MKNLPVITKKLTVKLIITSAIALSSVHAWAGDFFEKDNVAIRGYDPVAYFQAGKPVKGTPDYKFEHKGSMFHFSSQANRDVFAANPTRYAPQYNGFCAFGMASGYKAAIDPNAFTVVNDKLYLNYNKDIQKQWSADVPGNVKKADGEWPKASQQTKVIE